MVCNPGKGGYMYTWTRYYLYYSTEGFVLGEVCAPAGFCHDFVRLLRI